MIRLHLRPLTPPLWGEDTEQQDETLAMPTIQQLIRKGRTAPVYKSKSIALTDPTVAVAGNNAIARHTMAVETETDGKPSSAKVGVLQVWVKDGGSWKLLARQAFRV